MHKGDAVDYTLRVNIAVDGDVIELASVAEAMAKHAASGYGQLTLHHPTLKTVRPRFISLLLDAANRRDLTVCDRNGIVSDARDLVRASTIASDYQIDDSGSADILALFVKIDHMVRWGATRGDTFKVVDSPGAWDEYDLKNESGQILQAGYIRGCVGGGEPMYFKVQPKTIPAQTAATATPVTTASDGPATATDAMAAAIDDHAPKDAENSPRFSMTKAGLISAHEHEWPTIRGDIAAAATNGLKAAKADARGWREEVAMEWARAKGKLVNTKEPASNLNNAMTRMASLPSRKHTW